ncbi:JHY protein, partial [Penelope pileata]|nr:JHY protein [Penelope pileata]
QDSKESDPESLVRERQHQLELQQRIRENEELVGLRADELENDSLEEGDSLEEMSLKGQEGAEYGAVRYATGIQKSDGREQQSVDKYFNLRYNPNWKNTKEVVELSEVEKTHQVSGEGSVDLSQDSFYLHSSGSPEEKNQQEAKFQDAFSEFDTESLSFPEPNAFVSSEHFRLHTRGNGSSDGYYFQDSPSTYSNAFSLQIQNRPQRGKKDFVEKNKRTLGLRTDQINSYLQLHSRKQGEVFREQVDATAIDEEPVQSALSFQNTKMDPEDKWYLKSQLLKDRQNKLSQRNKSNQNLKGKASLRSDNQQPPGRSSKPKSWHHRQHKMSEFETGPTQAAQQDSSSVLQKWLCPSPSVGPDANTEANSGTCLNNFPNSRHHVDQDFTAFTHPFHPTQHEFNLEETASPAYTSNKSKNYQHNPPNGLPCDQQYLYNHATVPFLPRDGRTVLIAGQAHPNQKNISSAFNANCQEVVMDPVSLQDCKRPIYASSHLWTVLHACFHTEFSTIESFPLKARGQRSFFPLSFLRPSQPSVHSSPAAPSAASQHMQVVEQHHQEMSHLREAHLADDLHLFSPLPQIGTDSEVDPGKGEANQVKISRSNSEGYLLKPEKQKQCEVYKKGRQTKLDSKACIDLNVKLGGLGPDYEAIKEKKEKLKQQKEYAQRIKEQNMKNIALVQRLPTKPQIISPVSRQKALEYAKKIPRPKTFTARQSDEQVKEERVLPPTLKGDNLPPITSLETLQSRHEKEKQVVAAFRTLHIL